MVEIREAEHPTVKHCTVCRVHWSVVCVCVYPRLLVGRWLGAWVRLGERLIHCVSTVSGASGGGRAATECLAAQGPGQATTPEHTNTAMTMTMAAMTLVCDAR